MLNKFQNDRSQKNKVNVHTFCVLAKWHIFQIWNEYKIPNLAQEMQLKTWKIKVYSMQFKK